MIKFKNCSFWEIKERVCKYYIENDILVDSFWEEHALESNYYNHNSLKTQFNSGNYCSTRLLRIKF